MSIAVSTEEVISQMKETLGDKYDSSMDAEISQALSLAQEFEDRLKSIKEHLRPVIPHILITGLIEDAKTVSAITRIAFMHEAINKPIKIKGLELMIGNITNAMS